MLGANLAKKQSVKKMADYVVIFKSIDFVPIRPVFLMFF